MYSWSLLSKLLLILLKLELITRISNIIHHGHNINPDFEGPDVILNQLLNFFLQRMTLLSVMTWCPLMEGTKEVRGIPNRQHIRHLRKWPGLNMILLKQDGKQIHIFHGYWVTLRCFPNLVLKNKLLGNLILKDKLLRSLILKDKLPRNLIPRDNLPRNLLSRPFWAQRLILRNSQRGQQAS